MSSTELTTASVYDQFAAQAERTPNVVALTAPGRLLLTYAHLRSQLENIRKSLNAFGLGRNDRVVMVLDNGPEMAVAFMGIASCVTAIPLNPAYQSDEFKFYLSRLNADALVVNAEDQTGVKQLGHSLGLNIIELVAQQDAEAGVFELHGAGKRAARQTGFGHDDDVALILHTSGTTSAPKIVPLTQQNICAMAKNNQVALELNETDLCLNIMPLFHSTGLVGVVLSSLVSGAGVVCPPGFYAPQFFDWLREFQPTWFTAVPSMHQAILARARNQSENAIGTSLRFMRSSSSALSQQLMSELEDVFHVPVIESYGMTECGMIACNPLPPRKRKPRSAGLPTLIDMKILDQNGHALSSRAEGEIVVRGACVISRYEEEPRLNEESFTNGWFKTGDQGFIDEDGYLFITGRVKEIINRGGEKIAPLEVDQALLEHPLVEQAVTFPVANELLGEEVAAAVVLKSGGEVTEMDLREFVSARLAAFKVPRQIVIVSEIPKGSFGKLQRSRLADLLHVQSCDQNTYAEKREYVEPRSHEELVLADIWARILRVEVVGIHDDFFRLGGDSILATQVISQVRNVLGVELSPITMFETPTIAGLVRRLHISRENANGIVASPIKPLPRH
jgi:acyl-CoA synthetase (AMP-forming)/AMP-acid ligase II/acyl carrier protein